MTSIKKLTMAPTVMANQHISVQKSFFGLFSKAVYTPTGSPVTASRHEYAVDYAPFFRKLLTASSDELTKLAGSNNKPKEAPLGNVMIETCLSPTVSLPPYRCSSSPTSPTNPLLRHACWRVPMQRRWHHSSACRFKCYYNLKSIHTRGARLLGRSSPLSYPRIRCAAIGYLVLT